MLGRSLGFLLLLLTMLNHAVMACDSMVMHLPEHGHAFSIPVEHHSNVDVVDDSEHLNEHAHVACHIAFFCGIELLNFINKANCNTTNRLNLISYSPPVPPPNV